MLVLGGIIVLLIAVVVCVACAAVSRAVSDVQAARREQFEPLVSFLDDAEATLPGDERQLLADYRLLKRIEEDRERALYDGGGW